jgi:hypothetical protein
MKKIQLLAYSMLSLVLWGHEPEKDSLSFIKIPPLKLSDCDACGCAANANPMGADGLLNSRYTGIKYLYQHYQVKANSFAPKAEQNEYYQTWQWLSKIPLSNKWLLTAQVPYHQHQKESDPKQDIKGLGDLSVGLSYYVFNDKNNRLSSPHRFLLNAGLKLPTGRFDAQQATAINPSFQLGSGSWDWLTGLNYQYLSQDFAVQYNFDYIYKQNNAKAYQFGPQWNQALMGYYLLNWPEKQLNLQPKMGILAEHFGQNKQLGDRLPNTQGFMLLGKTGLDVAYQQWLLGLDVALPVYDDLAQQQVKPIGRWSVFVYYNF